MLARICDCCNTIIKGNVWNMTITNTENKESANWDLCSECHNRINGTIAELSELSSKRSIYGTAKADDSVRTFEDDKGRA